MRQQHWQQGDLRISMSYVQTANYILIFNKQMG